MAVYSDHTDAPNLRAGVGYTEGESAQHLHSGDVNAWINQAVRTAGDYRGEPKAHAYVADEVRAAFEALPVALQPFAIDRLKEHAANAGDANAQINAALVLAWLRRNAG